MWLLVVVIILVLVASYGEPGRLAPPNFGMPDTQGINRWPRYTIRDPMIDPATGLIIDEREDVERYKMHGTYTAVKEVGLRFEDDNSA